MTSLPSVDDHDQSQQSEALTPAQQKLFNLRLRMNKSRKDNHSAVIDEGKRILNPKEHIQKVQESLINKKTSDYSKELKELGLTETEWKRLNIPANVANTIIKNKEKKKKNSSNNNNSIDASYKSYKKRLNDVVSIDISQYNNLKTSTSIPGDGALQTNDFYRDSTYLQYGQEKQALSQPLVSKMAAEIIFSRDKRNQFSRKRKFNSEDKIDFINQRNKMFNDKLDKSYGKYTSEIERNLERGTAL